MGGKAKEILCKHVAEVRNVAIDFTRDLDGAELLTGTPSIAVTGLTVSTPSINTAVASINNKDVIIGRAVQFTVSGGTANTKYTLEITVTTDNGQTIVATICLTVIA